MTKFLLLGVCVAALGAGLAGSANAAPNLITNGSFETGYPGDDICGGWWYEVGYGCNPNNNSIPGWTQTGNGVDWHNNTASHPLEPAAQDGLHTIDLVGDNDAGAIAQTIPTVAGASYTLTFYYAGHPFCLIQSGGTASATASAGSTSITVTSGPTNVYTQVTLPFTPAGSSTTISFTSLTS